MSWYFLSGAFTFCLLLRSPDEPQWWRNGCRRLQPRSVLGPIGFVLMPYKVHLHVVRSALQNLMSTWCQFCLSGLDLLDFIDPTFCGIFFCGSLQSFVVNVRTLIYIVFPLEAYLDLLTMDIEYVFNFSPLLLLMLFAKSLLANKLPRDRVGTVIIIKIQ